MTKPELQKIRAIMRENRGWVLKMSKGRTAGWCAVSAFRVNHFLTKHGFKPTLVYLRDNWQVHCFNELDGMILDVTGDQFRATKKSKVIMKPKCRLPLVWYYGIRKKKNSEDYMRITEEKKFLERVSGWDHQSPQSVFKGSLLPA